MKIFSSHRKKLEARRRFGGREFQNKVKAAQNYKRVFSGQHASWMDKVWSSIGLRSKFWRWLGLAVLVVLFYFFVLSSKFVIADVNITGNSQVTTQQIQDVVGNYMNSRVLLVKRGDFFLLGQSGLNKELVSKIPTIKDISSFHKIWPDKLELTVEEHSAGFAILSDNQYFLVDDEGTVVKNISDAQGLPVAQDTITEDFATGETMNNSKLAAFILSMNKIWSTKFTTGISAIKFPGKASDEVEFTSVEGWTAFFNINRSASSELASLAVILNKQVTAKDRPNLAYVDLRLSNWAYYCFNNTPCQQTPQAGTTTTIDATTTTTPQP